jgi:hypothetical protein
VQRGWPLRGRVTGKRGCLFFNQRGYRLVGHDRRDHGRSRYSRLDGPHTNIHTDDLAVLSEALDLKNAIDVGHLPQWRSRSIGPVTRQQAHGLGRTNLFGVTPDVKD